jgi:hypothetical protein
LNELFKEQDFHTISWRSLQGPYRGFRPPESPSGAKRPAKISKSTPDPKPAPIFENTHVKSCNRIFHRLGLNLEIHSQHLPAGIRHNYGK